MMKIYLLGASNPETIRMIRALERSTPNIEFMGFLDNDAAKHGREFYGLPIYGGLDLVTELSSEDVRFVNLITGDTRTRAQTSQRIIDLGGRLGNFIHPSVELTMTEIGVGNYFQESVIIQAGVKVGNNTSVHMGAVVGHESKVGSSVFIAHAVSVSGCCVIGDGTFLGTNATLLPRIEIGKWVTVGAGTVITKDIPDYAVVVGNPGKIIRYDEA